MPSIVGSKVCFGPLGDERDIPLTLRRMSTEDVGAWNESFKEGRPNRMLGELETPAQTRSRLQKMARCSACLD
jgi:hypothetical protein